NTLDIRLERQVTAGVFDDVESSRDCDSVAANSMSDLGLQTLFINDLLSVTNDGIEDDNDVTIAESDDENDMSVADVSVVTSIHATGDTNNNTRSGADPLRHIERDVSEIKRLMRRLLMLFDGNATGGRCYIQFQN
ncbi:MAG: hypothetical protein O7C56_04775, partial [Rickettsia endosymbiont of Ixodes persulcatus]|nr:hypothetical protein [Rickettsia endosymbiont of Ixodes persulcatus]